MRMDTETALPRVWEVMSRDVVSIPSHTPRSEAVSTLRRRGLVTAPVVNEHMEVVGTLGPRELTRRGGHTVEDFMAVPAQTLDEERPLTEAADLLLNRRLSSLPVVSHGKLVGRLSRTALVSYLCHHVWVCGRCGASQRGLTPPPTCPECGAPAAEFHLEDSWPGL